MLMDVGKGPGGICTVTCNVKTQIFCRITPLSNLEFFDKKITHQLAINPVAMTTLAQHPSTPQSCSFLVILPLFSS